MKKFSVIVIALILLMGFTTVSSAGTMKLAKKSTPEKMTAISGEIISVDSAKKQIVVKDKETGMTKTIAAGKQFSAKFKPGDTVTIKTKAGRSSAESIQLSN